MLLSFHSLAGVVIATEIPNPLIAWPVALLSHFVLDSLPHWDFFFEGVNLSRKVRLAILGDFLIGLLVGLYFEFRLTPLISSVPVSLLIFRTAYRPFIFFTVGNRG